MHQTSYRAFVLVALLMGLVGCTSIPTGRYEAFSTASNTVSTQMADTYARIEKRERDFAVITALDKPLSFDSFDPNAGAIHYGIGDQLKKRQAALDVIVKYAQALESLAGKDFATSVDRSAQDLAASLRGISGTDAVSANIFGTVVDGLAKAATESMRKDALKRVMNAGQPGVDAICSQMQKDNDKIATFVNTMRDRYVAHAQAARPKYGTWERYKFDLEVANTLDEFHQINAALISSSLVIQEIPEAHRQILKSLDEHAQSLDALHDMLREAQNLRGFYRSLPNQ